MSQLVLNYVFSGPQLANPDGTLATSATGCTVVQGPGGTALGDLVKALDFGTAGKAQVNLPLDQLNTQKFCVRTVVKVDAPVAARQNLVESVAIPFSMFLEPIAGSSNYKAVVSVAPKSHGWAGSTTEFATTLSPGTWYTIDLIYDTDTVGVAVDGVVQSVVAFPDGTIDKGTSPTLFIGTWTDGARNHFSGSMAGLQLYDGIPSELEALLDERRNTPEWFITYKHEQIKSTLNLGPPSGAITFDAMTGGYTQLYAAGLIMYAEAAGAAFEMHGAIFGAYRGLARKSELGFLVSDEGNAGIPGSRKSLFSKGGIYWSGATGAVPVTGQIYLDYELMGEAASIGLPVSPATSIPGGREQVFQRARMYHKTGQPKAHEVHGAILDRFLHTGGVQAWGYPLSNELDVRRGNTVLGRQSEFENCTFYWRSGVGAFEVHGDIRVKYRTMNGPLGRLGFPTCDEQNIPGAPAPARANSFEHGSILWFGSAGNMFVCEPFKIYLGRLDTKESEGAFMGQNDLYFRVTVADNGHELLNKRYPNSGAYDGHDIIDVNQQLPLTITPNKLDSNVKVTFDIWESDDGAPFGGGDDHLGTHSHTLNAANAWGFRENNGILTTGGFRMVNSFAWAVQRNVPLSSLSDAEKWWGSGEQNRGTAELTYHQYGAAFRDVDPETEWWDVTDWLEKAFYELVVKGVAGGGNCFGMSLEAIYAWKQRSLLSLPLNQFHDWNQIVGEVNVKHEYQVGAEAIWWFVGQFLSGNTHDPVDVFRATRDAFHRGDNPVLCLSQHYDFSGAPHCIMPAGVWNDSEKPWKLKVFDPNFVGITEPRDLLVHPDENTFEYHGAGATYKGGAWSGGRLHYMPYCVLNDRPRTPIWDAILLLLGGTIFILGNDAETVSVTDESGVDLSAFGADAIARLKAKKPLDNKLVSFKGFNGNGSIASEVHCRMQPRSGFRVLQPGVLGPRVGANVTLAEVVKAKALPAVLQPLVSDPRRFLALAGRDIKAIAADPRALVGLDASAAAVIKNVASMGAIGQNVRHQVKGKKSGLLQYAVKNRLSEFRLTAPIGGGEAATVSLDDLGTHSSVVGLKASGDKRAKIEISHHLGVGKDHVRITIDKLGVAAGKDLQVNVKPGLGGVDILSASAGGRPEVSIEARLGSQVLKADYTLPVDGGLRLRPSVIAGNRELKVGKIDALFGPVRDNVAVKPKA